MRYNIVIRYIGIVLLVVAAFMALSALVSLFNGIDTGFYPLLLSAELTAALGAFPMIFVGKSDNINMKEGYAIVVGAWLVACLVGAFPYMLWGGEFTPTSSWFESVSGFTTTGATSLQVVEDLPRGMLFWRSCTHWLGGVGVVMFTLLVMPAIGRTRATLSSAELSPMARDNYNYKSQTIVRILLSLYVGLTAAQVVLLHLAGMDWFDAVNHSFSTVATGGFSTHSQSMAYFDNLWIEGITIVFMLLSGLHFGLIYATITGKRNNLFRSEVARYYLAVFALCGVFISLSIWGSGVYGSFGESLRHGVFQSAALLTTTGYATADTTLWTPLATVVLIFLMINCGCAGSTSGGIKSDRIWLAMKVFRTRILQMQHPRAVFRVKLNGITQDESVIDMAMLFIVIYLALIFVGTLLVAAFGYDVMTSFTMITSCMGNVGPGFGEIGSLDNFSLISAPVKYICTLFMLLGRLEIFGFIQLFLLKWWK